MLSFAILALSAQTIDIASHKQLFVDHKFIESAEGVTLRMNTPWRTGDVLIKPDAPWESGLSIGSYSTVSREGGKVKLWYNVLEKNAPAGKNPDFMGVAYAESTDGIHFAKPALGLVEVRGSRANNFVLPTDPGQMAIGGGSVMRDDNPNCPPEERYKSWQKIYPKPGTGIRGPYRIWVSADGLHWKLSEKLFSGLRAADTQPSWFWDASIGRYVGYSREWVRFADGRPIRLASYNESGDLYAWDSMHIALEPDEGDFAAQPRPMVEPSKMKIERETWVPRELPARRPEAEGPRSVFDDPVPVPGSPADIYGPGVFPYEGVYVALTPVFHHWQTPEGQTFPETSDIRLAVSRDRRHFSRPGGREPFLRTGPDGAFDSKWIWALPRPVKMGDELWIYYMGTNQNHSRHRSEAEHLSGISRAILRLDGFVSADFDHSGGYLLTPPVRFSGSRLELNIDTGAGGMGRVELLNADGSPIEGYSLAAADPLNGNNVRMPASWKGNRDVSGLAGKAVRIRFKMRSAKLYAFQFR